jgi:hypothetical protein
MHYTKLEETPRERLRVHELAKRVSRSNAEILALLVDLGEYAPHRNSMLEPPVVRSVYEALNLSPPGRPAPRSADVDAPRLTTGLTPPIPQARRENHPLMGTAPRPRDKGSSTPLRRTRPTSAPALFRSTADQLAQAYGLDVAEVWEHESWKMHQFTDVERDVWIAAGLRRGQAPVAAKLRDAGLTPADLGVVVSGWTVLDRLAKNEGAAAVARLLGSQREREAG